MTHVTGAQSFWPALHNAALPLERALVFKDLVDVKHAPRFIGANVAPGDFAQASSRNRFGVDKDGSLLGRTARTRGANDGQRGVGDSSLALSRRRAPFAQMGDSHLNRSPLPKKMFLSC
jgi:hypothetical protein